MLLPQGREGADSISFFVMIVMAPSGQNDHSHQQCHQRFVAKNVQGCRTWGWGSHGTQLQKRQTNHISHQEISWWPSTSPWISMANCKSKTIFFDWMLVFSPFQTVAFLGPWPLYPLPSIGSWTSSGDGNYSKQQRSYCPQFNNKHRTWKK